MKGLVYSNGDIITDTATGQCKDLRAGDKCLKAELTGDRFVEQIYVDGKTHLVSRLFKNGTLQNGYARLDKADENDVETARIAGEAINRLIKAPNKRPPHKQAMRFVADVLDEHSPNNNLLTGHDGSGVHEKAFSETYSEITGSDGRPILFFETAFTGRISDNTWLRYKIRVKGPTPSGPIEQAQIIDQERLSDEDFFGPAVRELNTERLRFFLRQANRDELVIEDNDVRASFQLNDE